MPERPGVGGAVVFDLGETLSDETRSWAAWGVEKPVAAIFGWTGSTTCPTGWPS